MSFAVTVLGSSGTYGTSDRAASGYLLELGDGRVWLDAGSGTWRNLLRRIRFEDIDGVVLTHRHPDHTTDVFQAFHARQYGVAQALAPIPLWAPQETLDALVGFAPKLGDSFDLRAVKTGDVVDFDGARFVFFAMVHSEDTLGVRVEKDGGVFAYSSDSGPTSDFSELARDADLFLCEATFQEGDKPWEGHMSAAQAGRIAAEMGVKHLVLTHLPAGKDLDASLAQARAASHEVIVDLAEDGRRFEVGR
jgi:ribonuclease BN (tRNA processing enzyme)